MSPVDRPTGARARLAAVDRTWLVGLSMVSVQVGAGFAGRLVLRADPALSPGDARIEWADGGVERTPGAVQAEISAAVDRYLAKQ